MELKFSNIIDFKIDFHSLSEVIVKELIDKNIILLKETESQEKDSFGSFFSFNEGKVILIEDAWQIEYNKIKYKLNYKVLEDIYYCLRQEITQYDSTYDKLDEIKVNYLSKLTKNQKVEYLTLEYYKSFEEQEVKVSNYYLVFEKNGVNSTQWKDLVFNYIWYNRHEEILQIYLCKEDYLFYDEAINLSHDRDEPNPTKLNAGQLLNEKVFLNEWRKYERHKTIADFCTNEINKLENNSNNDIVQNKYNRKNFHLSQKIILLDLIKELPYDTWETLSATKKGEILEPFFERNKDNIKKEYLKLDGNLSKKIKEEQNEIGIFLSSKINPSGW